MRHIRTVHHIGLVAAMMWLVAAVVAPGTSQAAQQLFEEAEQQLSAWNIAEARQAIDTYAGEVEDNPYLHYLEGRYAFYTGDYDQALTLVERAVDAMDHPEWKQLRDMIESTAELTGDYVRHVSESGNFEIYVEPGRDEVLVPYALEALEKAYHRIGDELGHRPDEPVRVEVYPRETVLAQVSLLTENNIRTSGTIALCQYNRLMITSPRAVLRGYSWVDTLIHEYVHLVINQRTTENVPIWMHEGIAKFLERQWRGDDEHRLEASSEHLLEQRLEDDDLIAFEDMHPSMALLPSQQDAAVAFAQVFTTMEYLRGELGEGAFSTLLDTVDEGYEARKAYARVLDTEWDRFENYEWRNYLHQRSTPDLSDEDGEIYEEQIVFDDQAAQAGNELEEVEIPEAREHLQLGQMFQVRDRYGAAAVQYKKAQEMMGDENPILQTRMAKTLTLSGKPDEAVEALQTVKELHPSYIYTWVELGRAYMADGNYHAAREALREAARINPFHPDIHPKLVRVADELGNVDEVNQARRAGELVQ